MGELFQKKPRQASTISKANLAMNPPPSDQPATDTAAVTDDINRSLGRVTVVHGAQEHPFDIAGKTVAYARQALATLYNIPPEAQARLNNVPVADEVSCVLTHNAILEFVKGSGQKGAFANHLYDELATKPGDLFFSPTSIKTALGMCVVGAAGETKSALTNLLGTPIEDAQCDAYFHNLMTKLNQSQQGCELVLANALWGQEGYVYLDAFLKRVAQHYGGNLNVANFLGDPDGAVKIINFWVNEKTRTKIPELITRDFVNDKTRLILTNAIYFKGSWQTAFPIDRTKNETFFGASGERKVPLMYQNKMGFAYYAGMDYQTVQLPYVGGRLVCLLALPNTKDGLPILEQRWLSENLYEEVMNQSTYKDVLVTAPRFTCATEYKLKDILTNMGAGVAFSDDADFSNIIMLERLKISEVIHKAFVDFNELGTEAAGATAVGMILCSAVMRPPDPPKIFRADHPFMFFIVDTETNETLFSGRYV